jgi:hypothetical protein
MNKKNILISFTILIISCGDYEVPKKQYEGYVFNEDGKALVGVTIRESDVKKSNSTKTDTNGYFKMNRVSETLVPDLIFEKKGYRIDTIGLTRGTHSGKISAFFLRNQSDTLKMKKIKN